MRSTLCHRPAAGLEHRYADSSPGVGQLHANAAVSTTYQVRTARGSSAGEVV
ncbi:hypothetical protein [Kribbella sp. VKM Ac-2568]|uniref:hypothetical protein n=1 Tax=Kribbella sp. VKM Ac-2568 TaxID=2512219 RepID=UPI0013052B44|nr:hypothetical protein [Kribbella sp. VKM Ac-2568]